MLINRFYLFSFVILVFTAILLTSCANYRNSTHSELSVDESIRVMTFNIRFNNPDDGPNAWPHRKDFVAGVFRFHKNDIVGIQEGLAGQVHDLDELLPEFEWVGVGRDDGVGGGEFCAIFYRPARFELLEDGTFWLSENPDEPGSMSWDTALTRIGTWARFKDRLTNRRFIVFNTHYDHRGVEARRNSSGVILEKIAELSNGDPVVLMGDLNTREEQEPYKILTDVDSGPNRVELFDGFYHSQYGHHGPTTTWSGFREITPNRRIDYIFVNSGFSVIQHGILADVRDGHFPSDHLPVVADIRFND